MKRFLAEIQKAIVVENKPNHGPGTGRMPPKPAKGIIITEAAVVCGRKNYSEGCYFCNSGMLQLHRLELLILQSLAHLFLEQCREECEDGRQSSSGRVLWAETRSRQWLLVSPSHFRSNCAGVRILCVSLGDILEYSQLAVLFGELFDDEDEH